MGQQHDLSGKSKNLYRYAVQAFDQALRNDLHFEKGFDQVFEDSKVVNEVLALWTSGLTWIKDDVEEVKRFADSSWNSYMVRLKRYSKWLFDVEDEVYPRVWRKVKRKKIDWEEKLKEKWLTERQMYDLLGAADHPRNKALIGLPWEGGFRPGEALALNVGDCKKASYGFDVTVSGKTGTRTMPIVLTAPLLETWLYHHPEKDNPQAPLFTRLKAGPHGPRLERIKIGAADALIKSLCRLAGIKKKVSMHWLRHTQCTSYADHDINEKKMRSIFGWGPHSKMPSRYSHITGRHTKPTVLALRGVQEIKVKQKPRLMKPKKCFRCGEQNMFDALHCKKCGTPLNREEAEKMVQAQRAQEAENIELKRRIQLIEEKLEKILTRN